ncbi:hypothetical protein CYY_001860 [Polysphondylium violaceum]|uniref:Rab3 GTPase-activating protein catalytic subunit n=1 Tax=Polysphondylium violaceum TaxID=133409 RepID=A0A8J4V7H1_9MYCE|nr:hypothetical protein CYY_001860 [Polysphondylium violaceum]
MVRSKRIVQHNHDGDDNSFEITDYTLASQWETLISKLEDIINQRLENRKSSTDDTIQFNNTSFQLIYMSPIGDDTKDDLDKISKLKYNGFMNAKNDFQFNVKNNIYKFNTHSSSSYQMENFSNWFGIHEYFLLLALRDNGPNISDLSTIMSAFTIALHHCNCFLPAFVGFDEKRYENFIGYMYAPISKSRLLNEDFFFVKFATESITPSSLTTNQNIAESFEKQLKIFYSKISVDFDDRNWDQFLSLSTTSAKYTYIKNNWDDAEWRYSSNNNNNNNNISNNNSKHNNNNNDDDDDDNQSVSSNYNDNQVFRWGYPMDPINELHLCVMCPPMSSTHVLENDFTSMKTPKSWFIKVLFRKPHNSLFQLCIGVMNVFNSFIESLKTPNLSVNQTLLDYNLKSSDSNNSVNSSSNNKFNQQQQQYQDQQGLMKTMGSLTKSLASSLGSPLVPTERELDLLLRDLFYEKKDPSDIFHFNNIPEDELNSHPSFNKRSADIKRSPIDSLFFSFCMSSLNIQSLLGIQLFWNEFIKEIKWHWSNLVLIPRTFSSAHINVHNCLIFQKLQMINYCIMKKTISLSNQEEQEENSNRDNTSKSVNNDNDGWGFDDDDIVVEQQQQQQLDIDDNDEIQVENPDNSNLKRLKDCYLLYQDREIVVPDTQDFGPMTDDMVHDQLNEISLEQNSEKRIEMQSLSLLSDMQSFKFHNPGSVFEDFIRWHSPADWVTKSNDIEIVKQKLQEEQQKENETNNSDNNDDDDDDISTNDEIQTNDESKGRERKRGYGRDGCLSLRMSRQTTVWRKTWEKAKPIPISKQTPLFNYNEQAEKALSYLENISSDDLLHQMLSVTLTSIATIFTNEKSKSSLSNEYCLGLDFQPIKQLVENYYESVCKDFPIQIPNYSSIKKNDFDSIFKSIQDLENNYSKIISLKTKFNKLDRVVNNLYQDGYCDILDNEFEKIAYLFFGDENFNDEEDGGYAGSRDPENAIPSDTLPNIKEYITRSYSPKPFKSSQTMPHKMYTCITPYECRVATCISEEDI